VGESCQIGGAASKSAQSCLFDYLATRDITFAEQTRRTEEENENERKETRE